MKITALNKSKWHGGNLIIFEVILISSYSDVFYKNLGIQNTSSSKYHFVLNLAFGFSLV